MANRHRGEVCLKLAKNQYVLRPSFQAICSIESEIGRSVIDILTDLPSRKLKVSDMESVIKHSVIGNVDNIGEAIFQEGLINIMPQLIELLELAIGIERGKDGSRCE